MIRRLSIVVLAAAALAGCVTDGYYHGGSGGDYYYGRPSVDYYYDDYYGGYGYPGWYGGYGYGHGYYGYGYPYYGWYGGYWDYPYYRPPYRPRPRPDDDDGPRMGGNLPPDRFDRVPEGGQYARPRVREGVSGNDGRRPAWRNPPPDGTLRPRVREPRMGGSGEPMRVRAPAVSTPVAPRPMVPAPRVDSRPPMSGRSAPRERVSRPPASRERDVRQEQER